MKRYYLRVRALSPLSITGHQNIAGQAGASLSYIPGTTLRGALAWQVLTGQPAATREATFQQLFGPDGLRCGPLYPLSRATDPGADVTLPLPLTARTCKRQGGFRTDPDPLQARDHHGALDVLIDALEEVARRQLAADPAGASEAAKLAGLERHERCAQPDCTAAMDRFSGYYQFGIARGGRWFRQVQPLKRLATRTAILEELGSARPGALFSREVLAPDQQFAGFVEVPEALAAEFEKLLPVGGELQVGAGRTAGLGRLEVADRRPDWGALTRLVGKPDQRQQAFSACLPQSLRTRWALTPITLLSDAILLDPWLRYASAPEPDVLRHYAELAALAGATPPPPPPDLSLFLGVSRGVRCAAWHVGSPEPGAGAMLHRGGRPRTQDQGIAAGSTFVLAAPVDQGPQLLQFAAWLEEYGLGERREEGYGQLLVAHPFHTEVTPQ